MPQRAAKVWGDVGGRNGLEIGRAGCRSPSAGRDVLVVVVGDAVAGAVGAGLPRGVPVEEPVGFCAG